MDKVYDGLGATMHYPAKNAHEPVAERNNRTIKERIRCQYHLLPFKAIPAVLVRFMCFVSTTRLTWFPAANGISHYYSPHMLMYGRCIDYKKHCKIPFGASVEAFDKTKNTVEARTLSAIYLRPSSDLAGGHECMNLHSGRVITSYTVKEIPMTSFVIKSVEKMAAKQGIKGLKFQDRNGVDVTRADWIT